MRRKWSRTLYWLIALSALSGRSSLQADDADRHPRYSFQDAQFDPKGNVDDLLSLGFATNVNRYADGEPQAMNFGLGAGVGLEYLLTDNVALGSAAKYLQVDPVYASVGGPHLSAERSAAPLIDENTPDSFTTRRVFLGLRAGGFILTDNSWIPNVNLTPEAARKNDLNIDGGVAVGMDMNDYWGVELAADIMEPDVSIAGRGAVGEYGMGSIIHYFRFRHPLGRGRFVPYIMTGPGAVYGEFNDAKPASEGLTINAKGIYPAVGVGGGLEYFITRNLSLSADARWLYTWGHEISINNAQIGNGDFAVVEVNLGLRLYLFEWLKNNHKDTQN